MPEFQTLDELEKYYGKLKKEAKDDDAKVKEIDLDHREARADFREKAALIAALDAHRTKVLATAGIPEDFHEYVIGTTPEEIDASAAKVKASVGKLTAQQAQDSREVHDMYAPPIGIGGGGQSPPGPAPSERQKRIHEAEVKINRQQAKQAAVRATRQDGRPSAGESELTAAELAQYGQDILGRQIAHAWFRTSQNPTVQKLYSPDKID